MSQTQAERYAELVAEMGRLLHEVHGEKLAAGEMDLEETMTIVNEDILEAVNDAAPVPLW